MGMLNADAVSPNTRVHPSRYEVHRLVRRRSDTPHGVPTFALGTVVLPRNVLRNKNQGIFDPKTVVLENMPSDRSPLPLYLKAKFHYASWFEAGRRQV